MIPNFDTVEANTLYRGGRPTTPDDYLLLESHFGVRSIVNLEGGDEDVEEMKAAGANRFHFLHQPITDLQIYLPFLTVSWFDLVTSTEVMEKLPLPIYIHCLHGQDRTGLRVALWRVRHGMNGEDAYREALAHGYRRWLNFGLNKAMRRIRAWPVHHGF